MGLIIGLLGGVASGKSTVARLMAQRGLLHVDADVLASEVVQEPSIRRALAAQFGEDIFGETGTLDRPLLAKRAFASDSATETLNALVHPTVRKRIERALEDAGSRPVVLDAPLLFDSPLAQRVTIWVFLEVDPETRDVRAAERGWAPEERARRETRQASLADKRSSADHVLENNGKIEDLGERVDTLLRQLGVPS
jgi:dephospho-CoA kinase